MSKAFVRLALLCLLSIVVVACSKVDYAQACANNAIALNAHAGALAMEDRFSEASTVETSAVAMQHECVLKQRDLASKKLLAEYLIFSGDYFWRAGNVVLARQRTNRGLNILQQLRTSGALHGEVLDEVLNDVRIAKEELREFSHYPNYAKQKLDYFVKHPPEMSSNWPSGFFAQ